MSKENKNAMAETGAPEAAEVQKNWGARLFAILLVAVCALAVVVLPYGALYEATANGVKSNSLMTILMDMFKADGKLLGILPAFQIDGVLGTLYALAIYVFAIIVVVSLVMSLIAIFSAKKAPCFVRTVLVLLACGAFFYHVCFKLVAETFVANGTLTADSLDIISLALMLACVVFFLLFSLKKAGSVAWLHGLQVLLCVVFAALLTYPLVWSNILIVEQVEKSIYKVIFLAAIVVMLINTIIAVARIPKKGGMVADLVRYIIVTLVALAVIYVEHSSRSAHGVGESKLAYAIIAALAALAQMIIVIIQMRIAAKKAVKEAKVEATEEAISGFHTEEYAETYAYEGGPVAGVLMAEEVNPSFLPHDTRVNTAGYDFYNCKSFDPFIATLNTQERNQFTELFILRFSGTMPEIPEYVVGGDNKEFFRKIFIYLGQYREKIPSSLLGKMYQFSIKI